MGAVHRHRYWPIDKACERVAAASALGLAIRTAALALYKTAMGGWVPVAYGAPSGLEVKSFQAASRSSTRIGSWPVRHD